jgi:hypothetical protein
VASLIESVGARQMAEYIDRLDDVSGTGIALLLHGSDAGREVLAEHETVRRTREREQVQATHRVFGWAAD